MIIGHLFTLGKIEAPRQFLRGTKLPRWRSDVCVCEHLYIFEYRYMCIHHVLACVIYNTDKYSIEYINT